MECASKGEYMRSVSERGEKRENEEDEEYGHVPAEESVIPASNC